MTKTLRQSAAVSSREAAASYIYPVQDAARIVSGATSEPAFGWWQVPGVLASEYRRQRRAGSAKGARMFIQRSLLSPAAAAQWVVHARQHYRSLGVDEPGAALINKPLRNYLALGFSPRERVRFLVDHYRIATQVLPDAVRTALARNEVLTIGIVRGNRGDYAIRLSGSEFMQTTREGELVLFMEKCSDGCILTKATFLFTQRPDGSHALVLGGFQGITGGAKGDVLDAKSEIVDVTRSLSNLRPKDVVLHAVLALADRLGMTSIEAVSNRRHVVSKLRDGAVPADYDSYWVDRQGQPSEPFGYTLPVSLPPGPATNKRDMHRANVVSMVRELLP